MLSRILGQNSVFAQQSIYETLRLQDEDEESETADDVEERAGLRTARFDEDLDGPDDYELRPPPDITGSSYRPASANPQYMQRTSASGMNYLSPRVHVHDVETDEIPTSSLADRAVSSNAQFGQLERDLGFSMETGRSPPAKKTGVHPRWAQLNALRRTQDPISQEAVRNAKLGLVDPKQRALWKWANVENLDVFLHSVYEYYVGNGVYSILLSRIINLLTTGFVVGFTSYLTLCINRSKLKDGEKLSDITIPRCTKEMSRSTTLFLWIFSLYWIWTLLNYILDIRRLWELHNFYHYLLDIPDTDMQTISWQEVVHRLMSLRDSNPVTSNALRLRRLTSQSKQRMDAHDIANRLMRKENYLIALFNKDILDLTIPLPFLRNRGGILTKTLEWNLDLCIMDLFFNRRDGQLRKAVLKESERKRLSDTLRARFLVFGWMNVFFSPLIITYFILLYFYRYFNEYRKNPGRIGLRQYTPLAEWKFREFNELYHLFEQRINMSYPFASRYVDQFPKDKTIQLARFVSLIASSFVAILGIATFLASERFLNFEITPGGNVLFYIGIFTTIAAVSNGMVPEEKLVYDPEEAIKYVIEYTHYMPDEWKGKLHSDDVKRDFMSLYDLKVMIFIQEILSAIATPLVLWFSLPKCSDHIVDFFRTNTVHVDGIGYVCSMAVFDFKRNGRTSENVDIGKGKTDNKMLSSYWGFLDHYGPNGGSKRRGPYPGTMSPNLGYDALGGRSGYRGDKAMYASTYSRGPGATAYATGANLGLGLASNINKEMGQSTLMQSVLLDPHHQPPPWAYKDRPGIFPQPTQHTPPRALTHNTNSLVEEDEDVNELEPPSELYNRRTAHVPFRHTIATNSNVSNLGGSSYLIPRDSTGADGDEEGESEDGEEIGTSQAGVLGLLYQFQRGVQGTGAAGSNGRGKKALGVVGPSVNI